MTPHPNLSVIRRAIGVVGSAVFIAACGSGAAVTQNMPESTLGAAAPSAGMQSVRAVMPNPQLAAGRPLTLYVGADYCPFCASMRWPLVQALSRFGSFSGLQQQHSTSGVDGFPSLATYNFNQATYRSQYVAFQSVETADANGNTLQQPTGTQASLVNQFDPSGGIPFVFVAGRYVAQLPYSPSLLEGRSFDQIQADINSASPDHLGQAIDQEADVITALLCSTDTMQPAAVCTAPQIQQLLKATPS